MQRCMRGRGQQRQPQVAVQQLAPCAIAQVREAAAATLSLAELRRSSSSSCGNRDCSRRDSSKDSSSGNTSCSRDMRGPSCCCDQPSSRSSRSRPHAGAASDRDDSSSSCCSPPALRYLSAPEGRCQWWQKEAQKKQQQQDTRMHQQEEQQLRKQLQYFEECAAVGAAADSGALRRRRSVSSSSSSGNQGEEKQSSRPTEEGLVTSRSDISSSRAEETRHKAAACSGIACRGGSSDAQTRDTRRETAAAHGGDKGPTTRDRRKTGVKEETGGMAAERDREKGVKEGTVQAAAADQLMLASLSPPVFSVQQWVTAFLRHASVCGLRHLLLRLLQLQRRAFLSSCLDPTQRVTHTLSSGRLKAERHSVRTADGYQIFFYRLRRVDRHCCCCCCVAAAAGAAVPGAARSRGAHRGAGEKAGQQWQQHGSRSSSSSSLRCRRAQEVSNCSACINIESSNNRARSPCPADGSSSPALAGSAAAAATASAGLQCERRMCCCCCASDVQGDTSSGDSCRCSGGRTLPQLYCCCCSSILKEEGVRDLPGESAASRPEVRSACTLHPPPSPGDTAASSVGSSSRSTSLSSCSSKDEDGSFTRRRKDVMRGRCSPRGLTTGGSRQNYFGPPAAAAACTQREQQEERELLLSSGTDKNKEGAAGDSSNGGGRKRRPHAAVQQQEEVDPAIEFEWAEQEAAAAAGAAAACEDAVARDPRACAAEFATAAAQWRVAAGEDPPTNAAAPGAGTAANLLTATAEATETDSATTAESAATEGGAQTHGWWRERVRDPGMFTSDRKKHNNDCYGPAVLMQHGLLESSLNWVSGGCGSLAFMLAYEGCDVWLGNNRGNEYTRLLPAEAQPLPPQQQKQQQQSRCRDLQRQRSSSSSYHRLRCGSSVPHCTRDAGATLSDTAATAAAADSTAATAVDSTASAKDRPAVAPPAVVEEGGECKGARLTALRSKGVGGGKDATAAAVAAGDATDAGAMTTGGGAAAAAGCGTSVAGGCCGCSGDSRSSRRLFHGRSGSEFESLVHGLLLRHRQTEVSLQGHAAGMQQKLVLQEQGGLRRSGTPTGAGIAAAAGATRQANKLLSPAWRARVQRRRMRISRRCCSALCCHCTGLTPFPVFGPGTSMQMQRQQLSRLCLDACAVLLQLGRCNRRSSLRKHPDKTLRQPQQQQQWQGDAREYCLRQVIHVMEADKEEEGKQEQQGGLTQQHSPRDCISTGQQEWQRPLFPQQRGVNFSSTKELPVGKKGEGAEGCDESVCATAAQEEGRSLGALWRSDNRSHSSNGFVTTTGGQLKEELPAVLKVSASDGAGATAANAATAKSSATCGAAQQRQLPGNSRLQQLEQRLCHLRERQEEEPCGVQPEKQVNLEGRQHVHEVLQHIEKELETATHEDGSWSCSSVDDDDVPPFRSALRSATQQSWTYRDMAAYDVPAMLDYILSVRRKEGMAGARECRRVAQRRRGRAAASSGSSSTGATTTAGSEAYSVATSAEKNVDSASSFPCSSTAATGTAASSCYLPNSLARRPDSSSGGVATDASFPPTVEFEEQGQRVLIQQQQQRRAHQPGATIEDRQVSLPQKQERSREEPCAGVYVDDQAMVCPKAEATNSFVKEEAGSRRVRESENNVYEEDEEEELYCGDFFDDIWAVGQSQGAAQLLAMLALYPAMGLLFRGVILFSPPVVLQSPATLNTSARFFINLALQMPERVLLGIRAAEQLLPVWLLSLFGDFVAGKRLMGFYTGSISWQQRCINFRYTPSGGTSKRNFELWVGSMSAASSSSRTQDNTLRARSSSDVDGKDSHAALSHNEEAALASAAADAVPYTVSTATTPATTEEPLQVDSAAATEESETRLGKEQGKEEFQETRGETEFGGGPAASYPLEQICCPVFALLGGKDNLVDAGASSAHLSRCLEKKQLLHVEIWEESGHLDFGWAHARRVDLYPRLIQLILSRKYCPELRKYCRQLLQQQQRGNTHCSSNSTGR